MNSDIDHLEELCTPRIYSAIEYERELGGFEDVRYLLGEDAAPEIHTLESYVHERSFGRIEKIAVNTFITTRPCLFWGIFFALASAACWRIGGSGFVSFGSSASLAIMAMMMARTTVTAMKRGAI